MTSTAFSKGPVPEVADFIAHNPVEKDFGKVWDRALPKDAYLYEDPTVGLRPARGGMTPSFPHVVKGPEVDTWTTCSTTSGRAAPSPTSTWRGWAPPSTRR